MPTRLCGSGRLRPKQSYLDADAVIAACRATGAQAVHPGYGFLSENVGLSRNGSPPPASPSSVPHPDHLRAFGLKHTAREIATSQRRAAAARHGSARRCRGRRAAGRRDPHRLSGHAEEQRGRRRHRHAALRGIPDRITGPLRRRFSAPLQASFGDARVFLERYVADARHVEVQIFGDGRGRVVALGERDCSLQRRNQKVSRGDARARPCRTLSGSETPCRRGRGRGGRSNYASAGTVEFIYDPVRRGLLLSSR